MKIWKYLFVPFALGVAAPALAAPAPSAAANSVTTVQPDAAAGAVAEQTRRALARLRDALEARKQSAKDANRQGQQAANKFCTGCPDKDEASHHHSASEARAADCIECADHQHFA